MKKITALLLCLVLVLSLFAGCGPQDGTPTEPSSNTTTDPKPTDPKPTDPQPTDPQLPKLTIAEILALDIAEGVTTTEEYLVTATIDSITNPMYGAMIISDETGSIGVYNCKDNDGTFYENMADKPYKGDSVVLRCTIQNFKGEYEIKQAYIVEFKHNEVTIDPSEYTEMSIADARDTATGTKVQVSGVVASITYANGQKPAGVILVDKTGSIYVYDNQLAGRVSVGNTITICASKTYWILDNEQNNANKFGYKGCNQLESVTLISNDNGKSDFDKSWIEETTVKEIMDTPVSTDISTKLFKVTAIVRKVDGKGFVNYYINDLDDKTGSYAYSQCNGADFAWLDAFDGKFCTVYVMALNAKSTASDCYWRFLPVAAEEVGIENANINIPEHVVKYYGVGQFLPTYSGNPALELLDSVSSELLNFKDAKLSYSSSDPSIISVKDNVMNCLKSGTATITVTGTYGGKTYSEDVTITVTVQEQATSYPTVADAIAAAVGEKVTVKGIVGPSLVNQTGFYLIDETGIIAVLIDADTLKTLEIGYEVVLEGNRFYKAKNGTLGTTCISEATVLVNNYGDHEYSTKSFDGELTLAEFNKLDVNTDYTTSVFTVTATVELIETPYYTSIKLTDGGVSVNLYCSSTGQYSWLKQYAGQAITMELAPCNWSSKGNYPGCVLAVLHEDGTKTVNTLNFND